MRDPMLQFLSTARTKPLMLFGESTRCVFGESYERQAFFSFFKKMQLFLEFN